MTLRKRLREIRSPYKNTFFDFYINLQQKNYQTDKNLLTIIFNNLLKSK